MHKIFKKILTSPLREYILASFVILGLLFDYIIKIDGVLLIIVAVGSIMPLVNGVLPLLNRKITIDTFNAFAVAITLATGEFRSSAFIILMLLFAYILDWHIIERKNRAIDRLMKLRPVRAFIEKGQNIEEIATEKIRTGDILVVKEGLQIPTDGIIIFGNALINESIITGESLPVKKAEGDEVFGSTSNISGTIKVKATNVGKDSTIERIAKLINEASKHKSRSEKIADRFAKVFLPIVLLTGAITFYITHNVLYVASLFLISCADDLAVAIPLAISASIGKAAKKGMIIKGGEWLETLSKVKTVVIDKTGTLTYGDLHIEKTIIKNGISENDFWTYVGIAEKLSSHSAGQAIYEQVLSHIKSVPSPESFSNIKGIGVMATYKSNEIIVGNMDVLYEKNIPDQEMKMLIEKEGMPANVVILNSKIIGYLLVRDVPRTEAKESIEKLKSLGIQKIAMFTGDKKNIAEKIGKELGIVEIKSEMKPEDKLYELEKFISKDQKLAMVGDGINDTPALMRADVGIAMGGADTEVVMETADAIIFNNKLDLLPEIISLGRKTMSVIKFNMVLWFISNAIGFSLVFIGFATPAFAAFYNFATDFIPLINSGRLLKK